MQLLKLSAALEVEVINTKEEFVHTYKKLEELTDAAKGQLLIRAKEKLQRHELIEAYEEIGISVTQVSRLIKFALIPHAVSSRLPDMASKYADLKGSTPEEKSEFWEELKEETGKDEPNREDIRKKARASREEEAISKLADGVMDKREEARQQLGWDEDTERKASYMSNPMEYAMVTTSSTTELGKFKDIWKPLYRELSAKYHPDMGGDGVMQSLLVLITEVIEVGSKKTKAEELMKELETLCVS